MYPLVDRFNQKLGKLTVIGDPQRNKERKTTYYPCSCECGNKKLIDSRLFRKNNHKSTSCGECRYPDLLGKKFGLLRVVGLVEDYQYGSRYWECVCNCGKKAVIPTGNLTSGNSESCGVCVKTGSNSSTWKGGKTPFTRALRNSRKYLRWVKRVLQSANYACMHCEALEGLRAHHIIPLSIILSSYNVVNMEDAMACEMLWDLGNGLCLCEECHKHVHRGRSVS